MAPPATHVPGSISIPLSGQFAFWAGTLVDLNSRPILIANTTEELEEARTRLARIGLDLERGYLDGGVQGWKNAGFDFESFEQIRVRDLSGQLESEAVRVLDVRRAGEWEAGNVGGAVHHPLDRFKANLPDLDPGSVCLSCARADIEARSRAACCSAPDSKM